MDNVTKRVMENPEKVKELSDYLRLPDLKTKSISEFMSLPDSKTKAMFDLISLSDTQY